MKKTIHLLIIITFMLPTFIQAQVITSVPPTTGNDRFLDEIYSSIKRPGLSVVGFDNGGDNSKGYGLKQILNEVFVTGTNEQKELFNKILFEANLPVETNPTNNNNYRDYRTNSNRLQYKAFEALASYILEENGISHTTSDTSYGISIRQHSTALSGFKNDIMALVSTNKLTKPGSDYVANVKQYTNVARAIDLYLALENAYTKWPGHSGSTSALLSQSQKQALISHFNSKLNDLDDEITRTYNITGDISFSLNEDKFEPGNRPLKGYMALAYATMGTQTAGSTSDFEGEVMLNYEEQISQLTKIHVNYNGKKLVMN